MIIMFHNSTQKNHWTFTSEDELKSLRRTVNLNYRKEFCDKAQNKKISLCTLLTSYCVVGVLC